MKLNPWSMNHQYKKRFYEMATAFAVIWLVSLVSKAQTLPAGIERITAVEGITEYRLTNGLSVLLFPDNSKPLINVNIVFKVGSRHEGYGEKGMAHLLEHLDFKGTPLHPNVPKELSEHGADANGTTYFDRTHYYETFPATEANLRWALGLEADRMVHSFIARKDLESEFSVVRNEYEMGENYPDNVLEKRMLPLVFQWHNYGRDTIGEKSDIELAPIGRLQDFYHRYYQPDNAVLIVSGKFDAQQTLNLVAEYFSPIARPTRQLIPTYTKEPVQDGERQVVLRRTGDVQLVRAIYRGAPGSHPDAAALDLLANYLVDAPSGPLYKALVESGKAASVSGNTSSFAEAGWVEFTARLRLDQSLEDAKFVLLDQLESIKSHPPTDAEVEKARTRLVKDFENGFKEPTRFAVKTLTECVASGDWKLAFLYRDYLEKTTPDDVRRAAIGYLKPSNRTLGLFIPEKKSDRVEPPDAPNLSSVLQGYQGKQEQQLGENFETTPGNIEKRTVRGSLTNGMRYALLSKKTRGGLVNASMAFRYGTLDSLKGKSVIANLTGGMLDKGSKTKSRKEIHDALDKMKTEVSFDSTVQGLQVTIKSDRDHLIDVLKLVTEIIRHPVFPSDEFVTLRRQELATVEEYKSEPGFLEMIAFNRLTRPPVPKDDPRYILNLEEKAAALQAATVEQLVEFHHSHYGATAATAAIVGDFDSSSVEALLRESFGDWTNPTPFQRLADDYQSVAPRSETILTPDKSNSMYVAGLGFPLRRDDPDYPSLEIGSRIIGGGFLESRLATRIRQKEGLSYGVGSFLNADELDRNGMFTSYMIFNPQNLNKLEVAFREEIERAASGGFTVNELEQSKSGWLEERKIERSTDDSLAEILNRKLFIGRDLNWDAQLEDKVRALGTNDVNSAVHKYVDYSRMTTVKAGDFKAPTKVQ